MVLFKVSSGKAKQINFAKLKSEKELQTLVESNLEQIFGLKFIESEFTVHPFRLDTVVFDEESKAVVIIEYKESEDYSIIDQGISYLNSLLNHKGDFQLALERKVNKRIEVGLVTITYPFHRQIFQCLSTWRTISKIAV